MMVTSVVMHPQTWELAGNGYSPEGEVALNGEATSVSGESALMDIARAAALCNDAVLHGHLDDWKVEGDPMEGAHGNGREDQR